MSKRLNMELRKLIEEHLSSGWSLRRIALAKPTTGAPAIKPPNDYNSVRQCCVEYDDAHNPRPAQTD